MTFLIGRMVLPAAAASHKKFSLESMEMFPYEPFDFGEISDIGSPCNDFWRGKGGSFARQMQLHGVESCEQSRDNNSLSSDVGFFLVNTSEEGVILSNYQHGNIFPDFGSLDDIFFQPQKEEALSLCLKSFEIIKQHISRVRQLNGEKIIKSSYATTDDIGSIRKPSTSDLIALAREMFNGSRFSSSRIGLSDEESKNVEHLSWLLAAAHNIDKQQFDLARKLLNKCDKVASKEGNLVQRLVHYFSEPLKEKIGLETGENVANVSIKKQAQELQEKLMNVSPDIIAFHQKLPFSKVCHFTGMQTIIENVAQSRKVHIIDLEIRNGMHFSVLMQALAARFDYPVEHLRITAIGTRSKLKIDKTGKRLVSFAESLNLPFSFNVVMVADVLNLNEDSFELDSEETVAVYSGWWLSSMIVFPDRLQHLMGLIRNTNPCLMVVSEVEADHNSTIFMNRFTESLLFYGAFLESFEEGMDCNDSTRILVSENIGVVVRNILAAEGEERIIRHVKTKVWKAFFTQIRMAETELSMSSLHQAELLVKHSACASSFTLQKEGESLIIGWKGTPIFSVSAWKFMPRCI